MYSKEEAKEKIRKLIEEFNSHPRKDSLNEQEIKTKFIEPLFRYLGWDFRSEDVRLEEQISNGRVDYSFRINDIPKFFIEAKRPSVNIDEDMIVDQAKNYAWHKATTWAVVSNFKRVVIYNALVRGEYTASRLRNIYLYEIKNFDTNFEDLWLLSKDSFEQGLIDNVAERECKKAKMLPVEKKLFEDLNKWRELVAKDVWKNYAGKYSVEELDEIIQVLLDRFILIKKIEDTNLEGQKLQSAYNTWFDQSKRSLDGYVKEVFEHYKKDYNSGIFDEKEIDQIKISDDALRVIIEELYSIKDKAVEYDFGIIDADVLGNIYEEYLGHLLKTTSKRAKLGKAIRKEQGIYYTPTFVVEYIVKNTLGKKLKECKNWSDVERINVLDPACGSGSFLIKSFDEINSWYEEKGMKKDTLTATEEGFETVKDKIIKKNLYGIDLDQRAIEIAQLNLLLKTADKKHKLPILKENIKCGNSLIDDETISNRPFKWEKEFPQIMKEGFDVIIGNPPYIRVQTLNKKEVSYFNKNYKSAVSNYDIYVLFIEKALELLKPGGVFGMILPNKFMETNYGKGIRKILSREKVVSKIVDFGDYQIFKGATTYTCLLFLRKEKLSELTYLRADKFLKTNPIKKIVDEKINSFQVKEESLSENPWVLASSENKSIMRKIEQGNNCLGDLADRIFQGLVTGADPIYILELKEDKKDGYLVYSKAQEKEYELEKEILKPLLKGKEIKRYSTPDYKYLMLFPYEIKKEKGTLIQENIFAKKFPKTWKYLQDNKKFLENREKGKMKGSRWYAYSRTQNLNQFGASKIMTQVLASKSSFTFDNEGLYYFVGGGNAGGYGVKLKAESGLDYLYLLGLLNSKLVDFYLKQISTQFRGGFYSYARRFIELLPIKKVEKNKQQAIVKLVEKTLALHKKLGELGEKITNERKRLESEIEETESEIDKQVYNLYKITDEEKKIIEDSLAS